ncbi:MAG: hypothetical protein ACYDGN_12115 [Acidimicrobiales bacterium]
MATKLGERNGKPATRLSRLSPGKVAPPVRRRSWPLVGAGVLAMAIGALGFGLARSSIDHRVAVLSLTRPVTAGQQVTASDLGVVRVSVSTGISVVPANLESSVVGRTAATNLVAGGLLVSSELGAPTTVKPGYGVVAVDLRQGSVPVLLQAGSHVLVVDTAAGGGSTSRVLGHATVLSVSGASPAGGVSVSIVAPLGATPSILAASAAGNISVVVLPAS